MTPVTCDQREIRVLEYQDSDSQGFSAIFEYTKSDEFSSSPFFVPTLAFKMGEKTRQLDFAYLPVLLLFIMK